MKFTFFTSNMLNIFVLSVFIFNFSLFLSQKSELKLQIDSLLAVKSSKPFNGIVLVGKNDTIQFSKVVGYSDFSTSKLLSIKDQFVIGSISKQFTVALVLQEYEKGNIQLDVPISVYLPDLYKSWKDSVTIHQLLTHTHGITSANEQLEFIPGTQFHYSQIGYDLLAKIIEKTSKKSFVNLSKELFDKCHMKSTFHPDNIEYKNLVTSYTEQENGEIEIETKSFQNFPAAGSFVSTAEDLLLWNNCFYGGKILKQATLDLLTTIQKGAVRDHPIFRETKYGYGITITNTNDVVQYGQTGFAPGFVSMNYYFPESKISVVVLENVAYDTNDLKKTFYYQVEILRLIKLNLK